MNSLRTVYFAVAVLGTFECATGATRYVNSLNQTPAAPHLTFETAATTIQHAVDASEAGDTILVTNGIYNTGAGTNRVTVSKAVHVTSINGPAVTVIEGMRPAPLLTEPALRCVYLAQGASLSGFTITNGAADEGGGILAQSNTCVVSNCVLVRNVSDYGGGLSGGTAVNCRFDENDANHGGGAAFANVTDCVLTNNLSYYSGGGAYSSIVERCTIARNLLFDDGLTETWGAGVYGCDLKNSLIIDNEVPAFGTGGGAVNSSLLNCTVVGNSAFVGGGIYGSAATNCIIYNNLAMTDENIGLPAGLISYTCTVPEFPGTGNITNSPGFRNLVARDLRLSFGSPGIDAGLSLHATNQLDFGDRKRAFDGDGDGLPQVDMGANEYCLAQNFSISVTTNLVVLRWDPPGADIQIEGTLAIEATTRWTPISVPHMTNLLELPLVSSNGFYRFINL